MQKFEFHGRLAEVCGLDLSRSGARRSPLLLAFPRRVNGIFQIGVYSYSNFIASHVDAFLVQVEEYRFDVLLRAQEDPHASGSREFI